jgi:hypothetical protein
VYVPFESIVGLTPVRITGMEKDSDVVHIYMSNGDHYRMSHHQDCCESVWLEDVCGDPDNLIGTFITRAEQNTNDATTDEFESCTYTFYRISTMAGLVVLRWCGTSNGYYSECVDFELLGKERVA